MDHIREAAIRARAYQLWIESGYADGQQQAHWRHAEREIVERERVGGVDASGERTTATLFALPPVKAELPHRDGTSLHPSVLDTGLGRFAA